MIRPSAIRLSNRALADAPKAAGCKKPVFSPATAAARRGSRRRQAFRRAQRTPPPADRSGTMWSPLILQLHYIYHPLTLQNDRDPVSQKIAVSTFLAQPTQ